jgi:hypothetical protein
VKDALKEFDVPHVIQIKQMTVPCSICEKKAEVKIFYSMPFFKENKPKTIQKD